MSLKIIPGLLCAFDKDNKIKCNELEDIKTVEVIKLASNSRFPHFRKIWTVKITEPNIDKMIDVDESMLIPIGVVLVRYPFDMPVINTLDKNIINKIINVISQRFIDTDNEVDDSFINKEDMRRLLALKEKIEWYSSQNDI